MNNEERQIRNKKRLLEVLKDELGFDFDGIAVGHLF
jgi:hypothetical protein